MENRSVRGSFATGHFQGMKTITNSQGVTELVPENYVEDATSLESLEFEGAIDKPRTVNAPLSKNKTLLDYLDNYNKAPSKEDDLEEELQDDFENELNKVERKLIREDKTANKLDYKTCKKCELKINLNYKFCPECGEKQKSPFCTDCGNEFKGNEKFCPECGTPRA